MDNLTQKYLLYKQFVAWCCNSCSIAPLTDYFNNPIYQELIDKDKYDENTSDERICLDLRASSGYTNEAEKLERNDSKINNRSVTLRFIKEWVNATSQNI